MSFSVQEKIVVNCLCRECGHLDKGGQDQGGIVLDSLCHSP